MSEVFTWASLLDDLVARHGTLASVAEQLAETRNFTEDIGSIERALRRLRARGSRPGGKWGAALVRRFGLPGAVDRRLRFMGSYHSRFSDLPVPVCEELVVAWDVAPVRDSPSARVWLALARASLSLRRSESETALLPLAAAASEERHAPMDARIERRLSEAYVMSRKDPARVPELLAEVGEMLPLVEDPEDRSCLFARWIDQRAYEVNHQRGARAPDPAEAERLYLLIDKDGPPFSASRRASGLAYCRWRQGDPEQGALFALEAAERAGDGGHVRLRAMALAMLARIDPSRADASARALAIARRLEDETLRLRFSWSSRGAKGAASG